MVFRNPCGHGDSVTVTCPGARDAGTVGLCFQLNWSDMRFWPRRFAVNTAPAGSAIAWVPAGVVDTFPPPLPHAPHVPLPYKHVPEFAVPDPNSPAGTSPVIRSAFATDALSTYCFVDACNGAVGFPLSVSGPVRVPPAVGKKFPAPTFATDVSTYALFATSPVPSGAGTLGATAKDLVPEIVSAPLKCTTELSFAFVASAVFTYCIDTGAAAVPDPGVVRTAARFAGEVVGTTQYSVRTSPGPN